MAQIIHWKDDKTLHYRLIENLLHGETYEEAVNKLLKQDPQFQGISKSSIGYQLNFLRNKYGTSDLKQIYDTMAGELTGGFVIAPASEHEGTGGLSEIASKASTDINAIQTRIKRKYARRQNTTIDDFTQASTANAETFPEYILAEQKTLDNISSQLAGLYDQLKDHLYSTLTGQRITIEEQKKRTKEYNANSELLSQAKKMTGAQLMKLNSETRDSAFRLLRDGLPESEKVNDIQLYLLTNGSNSKSIICYMPYTQVTDPANKNSRNIANSVIYALGQMGCTDMKVHPFAESKSGSPALTRVSFGYAGSVTSKLDEITKLIEAAELSPTELKDKNHQKIHVHVIGDVFYNLFK